MEARIHWGHISKAWRELQILSHLIWLTTNGGIFKVAYIRQRNSTNDFYIHKKYHETSHISID